MPIFHYLHFPFFSQINAEFMQITTVPLLSKFLAQLDKYTAALQKVFSSKGGASGQKISRFMAAADKVW